MLEVPRHTSHSAISDLLYCGKAYELKRVRKYPQAPAWWNLGGNAVHKATEWLDRGDWEGEPEEAFHVALHQEVLAAREQWPDESTWLAGGWGQNGQRLEHWLRVGPAYVRQWADRKEPWQWIELDVSTVLPSGAKIKGYIDRVRYDGWGTNRFTFADLKTSSSRPESDQQLGIYKVLLELYVAKSLAIDVTKPVEIKASHYMFKDDRFYPVDVSNWTVDTVERLIEDWQHGVEAGVFLPSRGSKCRQCVVAEACYLQSGDTPTTRITDRYNPHYEGD